MADWHIAHATATFAEISIAMALGVIYLKLPQSIAVDRLDEPSEDKVVESAKVLADRYGNWFKKLIDLLETQREKFIQHKINISRFPNFMNRNTKVPSTLNRNGK